MQDGKTPQDLASKRGHQSVVDYLETLGECTDECTVIRVFLIIIHVEYVTEKHVN